MGVLQGRIPLKQFFLHTLVGDDDEWPVDDACHSELVDTEEHAHVGHDLVQLHLAVVDRVDFLAQHVVQDDEHHRHIVLLVDKHANASHHQHSKPRPDEREQRHRGQHSGYDEVKWSDPEYLQQHHRQDEVLDHYEECCLNQVRYRDYQLLLVLREYLFDCGVTSVISGCQQKGGDKRCQIEHCIRQS